MPETDELERVRLDLRAGARRRKLDLAEIRVTDLRGEILVDLVAAQDLERSVFVIAACGTTDGVAAEIGFALSDSRTDIKPGVGGLALGHAGRGNDEAGRGQQCGNGCLLERHAENSFVSCQLL
jgi:hypothetical protein